MTPEAERALRDAAPWLARRDRTSHETAAWLEGRGHGGEATAEALEWLLARGFVHDPRVAEEASQRLRKNRGREAVAHYLDSRGVNEADAASALDAIDDAAERQAARAWIDGHPRLKEDPGRAARALATRGFSEETVHWALENLEGSDEHE